MFVKTTHIGEHMGKFKLFSVDYDHLNWCGHRGKQSGSFSKNCQIAILPSNSTLRNSPSLNVMI